jgi:hypothetical protein
MMGKIRDMKERLIAEWNEVQKMFTGTSGNLVYQKSIKLIDILGKLRSIGETTLPNGLLITDQIESYKDVLRRIEAVTRGE